MDEQQLNSMEVFGYWRYCFFSIGHATVRRILYKTFQGGGEYLSFYYIMLHKNYTRKLSLLPFLSSAAYSYTTAILTAR